MTALQTEFMNVVNKMILENVDLPDEFEFYNCRTSIPILTFEAAKAHCGDSDSSSGKYGSSTDFKIVNTETDDFDFHPGYVNTKKSSANYELKRIH